MLLREREEVQEMLREGSLASFTREGFAMKVVIVDLYGDKNDLYIFEDKEGIDKAIVEFDELDRQDGLGHDGFTAEMTKRGFTPLEERIISLDC